MEYPKLLLEIRASGKRQYEVAHAAGLRDGRLSEIVRRGNAKEHEQEALSRALGRSTVELFGNGLVARDGQRHAGSTAGSRHRRDGRPR